MCARLFHDASPMVIALARPSLFHTIVQSFKRPSCHLSPAPPSPSPPPPPPPQNGINQHVHTSHGGKAFTVLQPVWPRTTATSPPPRKLLETTLFGGLGFCNRTAVCWWRNTFAGVAPVASSHCMVIYSIKSKGCYYYFFFFLNAGLRWPSGLAVAGFVYAERAPNSPAPSLCV